MAEDVRYAFDGLASLCFGDVVFRIRGFYMDLRVFFGGTPVGVCSTIVDLVK